MQAGAGLQLALLQERQPLQGRRALLGCGVVGWWRHGSRCPRSCTHEAQAYLPSLSCWLQRPCAAAPTPPAVLLSAAVRPHVRAGASWRLASSLDACSCKPCTRLLRVARSCWPWPHAGRHWQWLPASRVERRLAAGGGRQQGRRAGALPTGRLCSAPAAAVSGASAHAHQPPGARSPNFTSKPCDQLASQVQAPCKGGGSRVTPSPAQFSHHLHYHTCWWSQKPSSERETGLPTSSAPHSLRGTSWAPFCAFARQATCGCGAGRARDSGRAACRKP